MPREDSLPQINNERKIEFAPPDPQTEPVNTEQVLENSGVPVDPPPQIANEDPPQPKPQVQTQAQREGNPYGHVAATSFPSIDTPPDVVTSLNPHDAPNAAPPAPPPEKPPPVPEEKKRGSKIKIIASIIILIILVTSSSSIALAYNNYQLIPLPKSAQVAIDSVITALPLPKTPRIILAKTQTQMSSLKSASYKTTFDFSADAQNFPVKSASLTISGPLEFTQKKFPKSSADLSGQVSVEGITLSASGSVRLIDKSLYFKLSEIPAGSFLPQLSQIKDQWFVVSLTELAQEEMPDTDAQIAKVRQVFENYIAKSYNWTTLAKSDGSLFVLNIKPPKSELVDLIFDLIMTTNSSNKPAVESIFDKQNIKEIIDNLDKFEIQVKIDKNYYLSESQINLSFKVPPMLPLSGQNQISLAPATATPINLKIATTLSDFNKPVIIEVPEGAKDLKDYAQQLEKELPKDFKLPDQKQFEATPGAKPMMENIFDNKSPVLGQKNTDWQMLVLKNLTGFFH